MEHSQVHVNWRQLMGSTDNSSRRFSRNPWFYFNEFR